MLLHEIPRFSAAQTPSTLAVVHGDRRIDFAGLDRRVGSLARMVRSMVPRGGRVLVVSDNHLDVVTAMYAVPAAAAVLVPANTRHTPTEIARLAATVGPALVLASPEQLDRLDALAPATWSIGGAHPDASLDLTAALDDAEAAAVRAPRAGPTVPATDTTADDTAWVIHTSGSTGRPKGVSLTHASLLAAVLSAAIARPLADDDVYLFPFPLFHVAAYNVLHAHLRRRPVVLQARFDAAAAFEAIGRHGVTTCSLAPTMLAMLLDHPERRPGALDGLRQVSYGASAMPLELLQRMLRELPACGLAQGYGMTELSGNAVFLGPDDHRRAASDAPQLLAAAGRPGPLARLRIVDDDGVDVTRTGSAGEILVSGDQVCAGYLDDPAATVAAFERDASGARWLRTGDVGRVDGDGVLYLVDRKKDIVITGGENVASREVEDVLSTHPAVGSAAVIGVADPRWGELVCAVVAARPDATVDADELIAWTEGRMAGFKRPRRVELLDALPLNASGKIDKTELRRRFA